MLVPDLLESNLDLVFCGTAPSRASAAAKAYYANPVNRFWSVLHEVQLTPRRFLPSEYPQLLTLKIGLTDLCKTHSGNDDELPTDAIEPEALRRKILLHAPRLLAFTSKTAARLALGRTADYGLQADTIGVTQLFVCCSTSGRARRFWQQAVWEDLAALARQLQMFRHEQF